MPPRPRPLTEHDRATWQAYARQVRALPGRVAEPPGPALPVPPAATPGPVPPDRSVPARPSSRPKPAIVTGIQPPGLDNSSWNRFRGGKLAPARTLDLHGKTAQAAHHALSRFLHEAAADRIRCVEVITGRGTGELGGVIRRELPLWLNLPALRPLVLATAHPHPHNQGAVRILLRRPVRP